MTEEIKAGSKLLAEFEELETCNGIECKESNDLCYVKDGKYVKADQFTYHSDYNELHRVWIRLRDLDISNLTTEQQGMYYARRGIVAGKISWHSHEKAFKGLVSLIEWLNSLKPKEEK